MKIIKPTTITDVILASSTVDEDDYTEWSDATTYAEGAYCVMASTHRIYKSLQGSNTDNQPDLNLTGLTPYWLDYGPTNRWAMFDNVVGTYTTATDEIEVVMVPGRINSVGLLELTAATVTITLTSGAETVYSHTESLTDGVPIADWYEYFFNEVETKTDLVLTDLPPYTDGMLTITISGSGTIACGMLVVGLASELGFTEYGCSLGIVDYSVKSTDEFGRVTVIERKYAKTLDASIFLDNAKIESVIKKLASVRATPCLWVGVSTDFYTQLAVFGFYNDFKVQIPYPTMSTCSLSIEGMI